MIGTVTAVDVAAPKATARSAYQMRCLTGPKAGLWLFLVPALGLGALP